MTPSQIESKQALGRELAQVRFGQLYRQQGRSILAYALRRVESPEDAADVVAETFLVAWRRGTEVPVGEAARLWLFGVARRILSNQQRAGRRRAKLAERLRSDLAAEVEGWPEAETDPEGLRTTLERLDPDDRELLTLIAWEELTPGQAARVLGISAVAARSRLLRARRRFRAELGEVEPPGGERESGSEDEKG
jgi:RNA polymerase sigma factor (sigma-70 family)